MNNDLADITVVLDRSGSMHSCLAGTLEGFNSFLKSQKEIDKPCNFSLMLFNWSNEFTISNRPVKDVNELNIETYVPDGGTALLDAVGAAIEKTGDRLRSMPEKDRPGRVLFVIITDGEENSSHAFTYEKISEMISHQREKYSWEFMFLGANQDAIANACKLGIRAQTAASYHSTSFGTKATFGLLNNKLGAYRSASGAMDANDVLNFIPEEKENLLNQK